MSGAVSEYGLPLDLDAPGAQEANRAAVRGFAIPMSGLAPGALSLVLPSPTATGVQAALPGLVTAPYGGVDTLGALAQHFVGGRKWEDVAHLPGGERASELSGQSVDRALSIVPHVQPENEREQLALDVGTTVGAMAPSLPAGVARALPLPARIAGHIALPGAAGALPAAGAVVGVNGLVNNEAEAAQFDKQLADLKVPDGAPVQMDANQASKLQVVEPPAPPTRQPSTVMGPDGQPLQVVEPGPMAANDETSETYGSSLKYVAGGLALAAAAPLLRRGIKSLEAARLARIGGEVTPGVDATSRLRANLVDENAVVKDAVREMAVNPAAGEKLVAEVGDTISTQANMNRYVAASEVGEMHGVHMPIRQFFQKAAKISDDEKQAVSKALHYGNEIENRGANTRTWVGNAAPTDADVAVHFGGTNGQPIVSTADLKAFVAQVESQPHLKELIDINRQISDGWADVLQKRGMITMQEAAKFKAAHQYYVPSSDMEGRIANPLARRNVKPGTGNYEMPAVWDLYDQHHFTLFKDIERNEGMGTIINTIEDYQQRNPTAPKVMEYNTNAQGGTVVPDDKSAVLFRRNGVLESVKIHNPILRQALQGTPVQANALLSAMNKARGVMQSGLTGAQAVAMGRIFPVTTALRDVGLVATTRPKGFYGTPVEKLTKGRIAGDPSGYAHTAYRVAADTGAEAVNGMAKLFNPDNPGGIARHLDMLFGQQAREAIHQRLQHVYSTTARGEMRERGQLGGAGYASKVVDDAGGIGSPVNMPHVGEVPELWRLNSFSGKPTYVHLKNFFNEMRSIFGEAPRTMFYQLNKDNPHISERQLNYEVRNITGDAGTHGRGAVAKGMSAIVPFGNVSVQGLARVARSVNDGPLSFMGRFLMHYGTLAAASAFTMLMAGPDAIRHYFDELTDDQRVKDVHLFVPGQPDKTVRLPITAEMRASMAVMMQGFYDMFQLHSLDKNPDMAQHFQDVLAQFFGKHIWQSTHDSVIAGVSDALPPLNTIANPAITALTGKRADLTMYNIATKSGSLSDRVSMDVNSNRHMPGQPLGKVDPVTGSVAGAVAEQLLSNVFGLGGAMATDAWHTYNSPRGGADAALHNFMDTWSRNATESFPGGNMMWSVGDKLARATPLQQRVDRSLDVMRQTATYKSDVTNEGFTRKGGQRLIEQPLSGGNVPTDPTMRHLYAITSAAMNQISGSKYTPMKELSDLRSQVASLRNSPLPPEQLRRMRNGLEKQIQGKYMALQDMLHKLNTQLSGVVGHEVRIDRIDWKKGPEQFD